jgi:hypothetical protein
LVQVTYPGVYVREVPSGVRTITGVATSITVFVGMASRGRMFAPTRVLSYPEFERSYSSAATQSEMATQVRQFFINGGTDAYIVRVADNADSAAITLRDAFASTAVLTLSARDAGTAGNAIKARVTYDTNRPDDTFNLTLWREVFDAAGAPRQEEVEVHGNVSMNPTSSVFVNTVVNRDSRLATATASAATARPGLSASSRIFANAAAAIAAINAAVAASPTGSGSFRIRIGNHPQATVRITGPLLGIGPGANTLHELINNTVASFGVTVTCSVATPGVLVIRSSAPPLDVVVSPGGGDDISRALGLGVSAGGVEVGSFAHARPRPNGIVVPGLETDATPGVYDPLGAMVELALAERPGTVQITGAVLPLAASGPIPFAGSGSSLAQIDAADPQSLAALRQHLATLAGFVNVQPPADWRADLSGNRVLLLPRSGTASAGFVHALALDFPTDPTITWDSDVAGYALGITPQAGSAQATAVPGTDGSPPTPTNYADAFTAIDREVDLFNIMVLPRSTLGANDRENIWGTASVFCERKRAFLIVDPPTSWRDRDAASAGIVELRRGMVNDHAAVYWPRLVLAADGSTIDSSGSLAGLMARTDARTGVWKAPAGLEATLRGVRGVNVPMSNGDNGVLNPLAVNALRAFPNGIVSWGSRTLDGFDGSGNDDYKHVPLRRLALFLAESLDRGLRFAVFQGNDERLWGQIRMSAGAFMNGLFRQGAFAGTVARDAYFVKCDSETTTQNDINLGIVNVVVGFAPLKPAEFIVIQLQQMAGQLQV